MRVRVSPIISAFILTIASLSLAACDDNGSDVTAGSLTGPGPVTSMLVTAVPAKITPEFLSSPSCLAHPAFRSRLSVTVRSGHDRFLRHMRFHFRDRVGIRAFPAVVPISGIDSTTLVGPVPMPTSSPVPLPTTSPIPIPGQVPFGGTLVSSSIFHTQAFLVFFDCGVVPFGTLFVEVEAINEWGTIDASLTSVDVGDD